ncbi:MAG: RlmE family RNA methyltransferase [Desulfovibrio sp.]
MKKVQDHYFNRAKKENYPARSVYKLQEIEKRFHIFKKGQTVVDLGGAPGSWTLFAAKKVGPQGKVLSVDLQSTETEFAENTVFLQEDVFSESERLMEAMKPLLPFNLVISDMAPKTTGHKFTDQVRSLELCEAARDLAFKHLKKGGHFVVKIFEGPDVKQYMDDLRPYFGKVKSFKPKSSRAESKEYFIVGLGFKGYEAEA